VAGFFLCAPLAGGADLLVKVQCKARQGELLAKMQKCPIARWNLKEAGGKTLVPTYVRQISVRTNRNQR
jgi:hypothetical protein